LILQREEVLVGLQVRIRFERREKPAKRAAELVLRIGEGLDLGGIVEIGRTVLTRFGIRSARR
jgi:hypothetical protein